MDLSTLWWSAAGLAVLAELLSGTFFLLMLALGLAAGALGAQAGASLSLQLVLAGATGSGAVLGWYLWLQRRRHPAPEMAEENTSLDQGATVYIDHWNSDGTAEVRYRGANWTVRSAQGSSPHQPGPHRIVDLSGSRLVVEPLPPHT